MKTSRPLRAAGLGLGAVLVLAALAVPACSAKKTVKPNAPPETILFLRSPVDPVNHIVRIYWFGTDIDGSVTGYELRMRNPAAPADTAWVLTTATDSVFTVYTPGGTTAPVFEVRAIDDAGARDPEPARQDFTFTNGAPSVTFTNRLRTIDTTYAAVTLTWNGTDPDGDVARMRFRVWLDGAATADTVTGSGWQVPTLRFLRGGQLLSGYRQAFLEPIDDGGRTGPVDSVRWFVRAPGTGSVTGRYARCLVIDDVPSTTPGNASIDTMYTNNVAAVLPAGTYSIVRLEQTQPFKSAADVRAVCNLFDVVLWYRSTQTQVSTLIRDYQDALGDYLDDGGTLFLEGLNLVNGRNATGALDDDFASQYLRLIGLYQNFSITLGDSTAGWSAANGSLFLSRAPGDTTSLRMTQNIPPGIRAMRLDPAHVAIEAPLRSLRPENVDFVPAIAADVPQTSGGRVLLVTIPLRAAHGNGNASRYIQGRLRSLLRL